MPGASFGDEGVEIFFQCRQSSAPLGTGDGVRVSDGTCFPLCRNIAAAMPDASGFGYENNMTCVVLPSST